MSANRLTIHDEVPTEDDLRESCNIAGEEADFYNRVAHEAWQFEANEMDDTDTDNLLAEYE